MTDRKSATAAMMAPRVLVNLAQEADDDFIWGRLEDMVVGMALVGALVKFSYFGAEGSRSSRPLMSTRYASDPDDLRDLLNHARSNCVCGCFANVDDVLAAALKESAQAVVIIGDRFSANREVAVKQAAQLFAQGARVFVFQEAGGSAGGGGGAAQAIAEAGGGACTTYDPAVERVAGQLPQFYAAVGHCAVGGPNALEALTDQSAQLLLEQIR